MKSHNETPILITGSHRSGTTWVGKIISTAENTQLFWEPFSPYNLRLYLNLRNRPWFYSVTAECADDFKLRMKNLIENKFYKNHFNRLALLLKYKMSPRKMRLLWKSRKKPSFYIPILKDPIALFSSEWLYHNFNTKNIVIIRHPAGFISSLKKNNWRFDFSNFERQTGLLSGALSTFKEDIKIHSTNDFEILDQGILLWNIIHEYIYQLKKKHQDWYFVRLEDLALQPQDEFEKIFNYLKLPMTGEVKSMIDQTTSSTNKTERDKHVNLVYRDSKGIINIWKERLSKDEQLKIFNGCRWSYFYTKNDWE